MTEIPEHLLKRSQARKAGGDAAAASATPAVAQAATPAVAAAPKAAVAPAGPPPAKPDLPVVAAYKARKKIPVWAMVTLSILPLWAFMYVLALKPAPVKASGPLGDGTKVYSVCASCHGGGGEGVAGGAYGFTNGSVLATFPHIEDQLRWVTLGGGEYSAAGIKIAGDPNREGGAHIVGSNGVMPAAKSGLGLTEAEILAAVCHERYDLGGADKAGAFAEEYTLWCAPASPIYAALKDGSANFDNLHTKFAAEKVLEIGSVPVEGSSK